MKALELTEEQQEKLLEMCTSLFPEYKRIKVWDYQIDVDRNHYNPFFVDLYKGELTVPYDIYSIPWFEFCVIHLFDKLHKNVVGYALTAMLCHSEHPVDYLYEEYKKTLNPPVVPIISITDRVKKIVLSILGGEDLPSVEHQTWTNFGADSLDIVEIVMEIEKAFGISIPDEQIENLHNINDVSNWIKSKKL